MENDKFSKVLTDLLIRKGFTDAMLAEKIGRDRTTVYRWRTEGRPPEPMTLKLVCDALHLTKEETTELITTAGYVVEFGRPEKAEQPTEGPVPPAREPYDFEKDPLLTEPEPDVVPFDLAEILANPPKPPETTKTPTPPQAQSSAPPRAQTSEEGKKTKGEQEIEKLLEKIRKEILEPIVRWWNQKPSPSESAQSDPGTMTDEQKRQQRKTMNNQLLLIVVVLMALTTCSCFLYVLWTAIASR